MTAHRIPPEKRDVIAREVWSQHAIRAAIVVTIALGTAVPQYWYGGDARVLGIGVVVAAGLGGAMFLDVRRDVALALESTVWSDDQGIVLLGPGRPALEVRRDQVTRVLQNDAFVVLHPTDGAPVRFSRDRTDAALLVGRLTSWAPRPVEPLHVVSPAKARLYAVSAVGVLLVHLAVEDPWVATLTGAPLIGLVGWAAVFSLQTRGLPPIVRFVGMLLALMAFVLLGRILTLWTMSLP